MTVEKSKPFDYAQDVTKQLITLSTGVVTVTVAFVGTIAPDAPSSGRVALYIAWGLFGLTILAGVATLLNLTGRVGSADKDGSKGIDDLGIRFFAIAQIALFVLAMVGTIYFGVRSFEAAPSGCKETRTDTVERPGGHKVEMVREQDC
jgi:hypothetical protein